MKHMPQALLEGYVSFKYGRLRTERARYHELAAKGQKPECDGATDTARADQSDAARSRIAERMPVCRDKARVVCIETSRAARGECDGIDRSDPCDGRVVDPHHLDDAFLVRQSHVHAGHRAIAAGGEYLLEPQSHLGRNQKIVADVQPGHRPGQPVQIG